MGLPTVTGTGTLTADPELRFVTSGKAVVSVNIAHNERYKKDGEWVDGGTTFLRGSVWGDYAENVAESLSKGTQVTYTGTLKQREYETREGEKRTVFELGINEIGPTLRFATAQVLKAALVKPGSPSAAKDDSGWGAASDTPDW